MVDLKKIPKAELHLHLEGAISPSIFLSLSKEYRTKYSSLTEDQVGEQLFQYTDFYDFIRMYRVLCEHLRKPSDYVRILDWLAKYFVQENIRYAEIIYTPSIPWKFKRDAREILVSLLRKSSEIQSSHGVIIRWILDCVRQWEPSLARKTAELAVEFQEEGVVALGLGGDERSSPMESFQEVFSWAKSQQLFIHVHAGEVGGPDQIWKALQVLGANRIGHGIQAARDPELMKYLRSHAIALDICLTSNLKTGAWTPISENPFGLLYRRGVFVTLSTDDPGLFETSLTREFEKAVRYFRLEESDIHRIVLQSVHSSFLPRQEKMKLMEQFLGELV